MAKRAPTQLVNGRRAMQATTRRRARATSLISTSLDGDRFDRTIGRYNKEYELFSFASDHGLYTDCEALGGSDSGVYVGGAPNTCGPNTEGRINTVVRRCKMHHNALGFSGTQGSFVWMHDNDFYDNAIGISYDSETDHPAAPTKIGQPH